MCALVLGMGCPSAECVRAFHIDAQCTHISTQSRCASSKEEDPYAWFYFHIHDLEQRQ